MPFPVVDLLRGTIAGTHIRSFGDALTDTSADAKYALGTKRTESAAAVALRTSSAHSGEVVWVYVQNDEGSALAQGQIVCAGNGAGNGALGTVLHKVVISEAAATPDRVAGVVNHAIAAAYYGWIIQSGYCEVQTDGNVSAGDQIISGDTGYAHPTVSSDTAATDTNEFIIGTALDTDAGAGTLVTAILRAR